jgi:hypothetical protein
VSVISTIKTDLFISPQVVVNMTPSSAEELSKIDVLSSQSTGPVPSPVIDLDSATKSKARMAK